MENPQGKILRPKTTGRIGDRIESTWPWTDFHDSAVDLKFRRRGLVWSGSAGQSLKIKSESH